MWNIIKPIPKHHLKQTIRYYTLLYITNLTKNKQKKYCNVFGNVLDWKECPWREACVEEVWDVLLDEIYKVLESVEKLKILEILIRTKLVDPNEEYIQPD